MGLSYRKPMQNNGCFDLLRLSAFCIKIDPENPEEMDEKALISESK